MLARIGLDLDGVLVNSFALSHESLVKAFVDHGQSAPSAEDFMRCMTSDWKDFYRRLGLTDAKGEVLPVWRDIEASFLQYHRAEIIPEFIPGATDFFKNVVSKYGADQVFIITNSHPERAMAAFEKAGLDSVLKNKIICAEGLKTQALQSAHIDVYVGDTMSDAYAALRAEQRPGFIGLAHEYAFNPPAVLRSEIWQLGMPRFHVAHSFKEAQGLIWYLTRLHFS